MEQKSELKYKTFWDEDDVCKFVNENVLTHNIKSITFRNGTGYVIFYV